jgi:hypothetical protein
MGRKDKETGEARECSRACLSTASCVVPPPAEFMTVCGRSFLSQIREFTSMVASQWAAKPFISWAQLKVNQTPVCSTCRSCGSLRTYLVAADARARRNGCSCKGTPPSPRREGSKNNPNGTFAADAPLDFSFEAPADNIGQPGVQPANISLASQCASMTIDTTSIPGSVIDGT